VEGASAESEAAEAGYLKGQTLEDMDRRDDAVTTYRALASRYPARNVAGLAPWRPRRDGLLAGEPHGAAGGGGPAGGDRGGAGAACPLSTGRGEFKSN